MDLGNALVLAPFDVHFLEPFDLALMTAEADADVARSRANGLHVDGVAFDGETRRASDRITTLWHGFVFNHLLTKRV